MLATYWNRLPLLATSGVMTSPRSARFEEPAVARALGPYKLLMYLLIDAADPSLSANSG